MIAIHPRYSLLLLLVFASPLRAQTADGEGVGLLPTQNAAKKDLYGDPLPEGALARLGTTRWRHGGPVTFVGYATRGDQIITGCTDGVYRVFDVAGGNELRRWSEPATTGSIAVRAAAVGAGDKSALSADGGTLVIQVNGKLFHWDLKSSQPQPRQLREAGLVRRGGAVGNSLALSPDGKLLAIRNIDQSVELLEVAAEKTLRKLSPPGGVDRRFFTQNDGDNVTFLLDGKFVVSVSREVFEQKPQSTIRIYEVETGKMAHQIRASGMNMASSALVACGWRSPASRGCG